MWGGRHGTSSDGSTNYDGYFSAAMTEVGAVAITPQGAILHLAEGTRLDLENGRIVRLGSAALRGHSTIEPDIPLGQPPVKRAMLNYCYDVLSTEERQGWGKRSGKV